MVRRKARLLAMSFMIALVVGADGGRAETAEQNYRLYCVQCHGTRANGEGINYTAGALAVSPRDHTSAKDMSKLSDEDIRLAITRGGDAVSKSELMPPWGGVLTAEEIDGLVLYLRKLCACEGRNGVAEGSTRQTGVEPDVGAGRSHDKPVGPYDDARAIAKADAASGHAEAAAILHRPYDQKVVHSKAMKK